MPSRPRSPHNGPPIMAARRIGFPILLWAVTPGQSVVLYQGKVCLGGGVIQ